MPIERHPAVTNEARSAFPQEKFAFCREGVSQKGAALSQLSVTTCRLGSQGSVERVSLYKHLARPRVEPGVQVLAVHERRRVKGHVREPLGAEGVLVCLNRVRDAVGLVVHDDGEQVVAVGEAVASRLVDEDAEDSDPSI